MPRSRFSTRIAKMPVTSAIGRLTMKIQCQLMTWVIAPPASSPIEPPAEATNE